MHFKFEDLTNSEKARLCDFMLSKRVSAFLGSGVSLDSSGSEPTMASAGQLRESLVSQNGLPLNASLQQAYSAMTVGQVEHFVTDHYTCTNVGPTIRRLAAQPWRRVYTLNVDNCFEAAFEALIKQREFDINCLEVLNFDDGFSELFSDIRCSIIHLHGCVTRTKSGYIFRERLINGFGFAGTAA